MGRVGVFVSLGFVGFLVLAGTGVLPPRLSERAESDAYYARVHIGLTHKGVPADIDFIVRCKDNVTRWRSGGSSHDPSPDKGPRIFVREIDGGHAVGTGVGSRPGGFDVCSGSTTQNGKVPADWLPFVVWYERAEDLSFGLGYVTQDAYERPGADLEFHGATVERSTPEAFEAHMKVGPRNLMPPWASGYVTGSPPPLPNNLAPLIAEPWRAWSYDTFGMCRGVTRVPLLAVQRELARTWRPQGGERFWIPSDGKTADDLRRALRTSPNLPTPYEDLQQRWASIKTYNWAPRDAERGDMIDESIVTQSAPASYRPQVFPVRDTSALRTLTEKRYKNNIWSIEAQIGDNRTNLGLIFCEKFPNPKFLKALSESEAFTIPAFTEPYKCKIDKIEIASSHDCFWGTSKAIDGDEFVVSMIRFLF